VEAGARQAASLVGRADLTGSAGPGCWAWKSHITRYPGSPLAELVHNETGENLSRNGRSSKILLAIVPHRLGGPKHGGQGYSARRRVRSGLIAINSGLPGSNTRPRWA